MKYFLTLLFCLFISLQNKGQGKLLFPHDKIQQNDEAHLIQYLQKKFEELNYEGIELKKEFEKSTPFSQHVSFQILIHQIPLFRSCIKINLDKHGTVLSIKKEGTDFASTNLNEILKQQAMWIKLNTDSLTQTYKKKEAHEESKKLYIYSKANHAEIALAYSQWNRSFDETLLLDQDGRLLENINHLRYLNKDTTVSVKIFKPDPLTAIQQVYGGIYVDNGDANDTWMQAVYQIDTVQATFDDVNQLFYLENNWVKLDDFESPTLAPASASLPEFYFTRNQSGFEDANAIYHITNFHHWISALGYDTLMDLQLLVDAHGQFGADNSVFNRNGGNPTVAFGIGGVDDAEDADVIVHEYCHGVSWSANGNANFSVERSALDEGLADYFATSYSRNINAFNWQQVFSWDGHNPFFLGRTATTSNNYPNTGNIYAVGEIWNAAMSGIWTDLGAVVTDKLMLESLHFFTDQTTLPEAALYVMQADTLLFGGANANTICTRFRLKNLFNDNCRPLETDQSIATASEVNIQNSLGFAKNEGDMMVQFPTNKNRTLFISNIMGQTIRQIQLHAEAQLQLNPSAFSPGVYCIRWFENNKQQVIKFEKW